MKYFFSSIFIIFFHLIMTDVVQAYYYDDMEDHAIDLYLDDISGSYWEWLNVANPNLKVIVDSDNPSNQIASSTGNVNYVSYAYYGNASSTYIAFKLKINSGIGTFGINTNAGASVSFYSTAGDIRTYDHPVSTTIIDNYDPDKWYQLEFFISCDTDNWKYRIDGGEWSADLAFRALYPTCTNTNYFIFDDNASTDDFSIDDVYANETVDWERLQEAVETTYIDPANNQTYWEALGGNDYIVMNNIISCLINEPCTIDFQYANEAVGGTFYLLPYSAGMFPIIDVSSIATSSYVVSTLGYMRSGSFTVQSSQTASGTPYCVYWQATTTISEADRIYCDYSISFYDATELNNFLSNFVDCSTICDDISTSTDWTGGFWYGLECGARKTACWAFIPSSSTVKKFTDTLSDYQNEFPFKLYYDYQNTIASSTASTSAQISLDAFFPGDNSDIIIFSPSLISSKLGNTWTILYQSLEKILYFLTFIYFFNWFIKSRDKKQNV